MEPLLGSSSKRVLQDSSDEKVEGGADGEKGSHAKRSKHDGDDDMDIVWNDIYALANESKYLRK